MDNLGKLTESYLNPPEAEQVDTCALPGCEGEIYRGDITYVTGEGHRVHEDCWQDFCLWALDAKKKQV